MVKCGVSTVSVEGGVEGGSAEEVVCFGLAAYMEAITKAHLDKVLTTVHQIVSSQQLSICKKPMLEVEY